eukprot:233172-Alexandrium_andersonii.AAC.1
MRKTLRFLRTPARWALFAFFRMPVLFITKPFGQAVLLDLDLDRPSSMLEYRPPRPSDFPLRLNMRCSRPAWAAQPTAEFESLFLGLKLDMQACLSLASMPEVTRWSFALLEVAPVGLASMSASISSAPPIILR